MPNHEVDLLNTETVYVHPILTVIDDKIMAGEYALRDNGDELLSGSNFGQLLEQCLAFHSATTPDIEFAFRVSSTCNQCATLQEIVKVCADIAYAHIDKTIWVEVEYLHQLKNLLGSQPNISKFSLGLTIDKQTLRQLKDDPENLRNVDKIRLQDFEIVEQAQLESLSSVMDCLINNDQIQFQYRKHSYLSHRDYLKAGFVEQLTDPVNLKSWKKLVERQAVSIAKERDRHSTDGPTAGDLAHQVKYLSPKSKLLDALRAFKRDPQLQSLPVVNNKVPLGFIHKSELLDLFTTQFGRQTYGPKPCYNFISDDHLTIEASASLDQISELLTTDEDLMVRQHFIITQENEYFGVGHTRDLLKNLTDRRLNDAYHANPLTLLPGNPVIRRELENSIKSQDEFTFGYVDINHFKPFNDHFGYHQGDQVITLLANLLVDQMQQQGGFVGHVGGDDFVLLLPSLAQEASCHRVIDQFDISVQAFYSKLERQQGYIVGKNRDDRTQRFPLLSVSIGLIPSTVLSNRSFEEVSTLSSFAKKVAKRNETSTVVTLTPDLIQQYQQSIPVAH